MSDIELAQGAAFDITIFQGGTYARAFMFATKDPDTGIVTRKALAGYEAKAQVRSRPGGTLLAEFTVDVSQVTDTDDEDCGRVDISLEADDSAAIPTSGAWDIAISNNAGDRTYIIQGKAKLDRRVTVVEEVNCVC